MQSLESQTCLPLLKLTKPLVSSIGYSKVKTQNKRRLNSFSEEAFNSKKHIQMSRWRITIGNHLISNLISYHILKVGGISRTKAMSLQEKIQNRPQAPLVPFYLSSADCLKY